MIRRPPRSTPFPCTPLFRSRDQAERLDAELVERARVDESATACGEVRGERRDGEQPRCERPPDACEPVHRDGADRKSTRLNSSHSRISYAVFCLKKKNCTHFSSHDLCLIANPGSSHAGS